MILYNYRAKVIKILDADTIELAVDLGFAVQANVRIRLMGIDAFETRTKDLPEKAKGLELKRRLTDLLTRYEHVYLRSSKDQTFNRWLGEIFLDASFTFSINAEIHNWMIELNGNANNSGIIPRPSV